jgi:carbon-monoxide dehydrogenase small subunit
MTTKKNLTFTINGKNIKIEVEPRRTLLDVIRDDLQLTGTKEGCSNGNCGACTVIVDDLTVNTCCILALEVEGAKITTIEGFNDGTKLHPIQSSFIENGGLQCGICTPGLILSTHQLLESNPNPSEHEIRFALAGNLCRCTGYDKIILSVQKVIENSN